MDDIKKLFGKKIKELRVKKNLSQEELAEIIDIAERNMRAEKIGKLAEALGVTPKDLFDFEHQKGLDEIRAELIEKIKSDNKNLRILYQFYKILE